MYLFDTVCLALLIEVTALLLRAIKTNTALIEILNNNH